MSKPLKELLELHEHGHSAEEGDAWGYEMARRLRKLDRECRETCLFTVDVSLVRRILDGEE